MPSQDEEAIVLLEEDHHGLERLFQQYKDAHDDGTKHSLTRQICQELTVHTQIEHEIFYPAFQRATNDTARVQDGEREHREAMDLIHRIEARQFDDQLMQQLEKAVMHHIGDERDKMFPEARQAQGMDMPRLARELMERKAELVAAHT